MRTLITLERVNDFGPAAILFTPMAAPSAWCLTQEISEKCSSVVMRVAAIRSEQAAMTTSVSGSMVACRTACQANWVIQTSSFEGRHRRALAPILRE